jgi:predicted Zn-dependent protease
MHNENGLNKAQELWFRFRGVFGTCGLTLCLLVSFSCSLTPSISVVKDERIERLLREETAQILAVTEDATNASRYQIFLSDFPRADILGMSIGRRRIYINYKLGRRALTSQRHLWLLRQTLAHEIAHEIAGHVNQSQVSFNRSSVADGMTSRDVGLPWYVKFQPYSLEKELQADLEGMKYWEKLHWDCTVWVRILKDFQRQNYSGDGLHPTDTRLKQAVRACRPKAGPDGRQVHSSDPLSIRRPS